MTLLTEQEAKEKWCPFARLVIASGNHATAGFNRSVEKDANAANPPSARCISAQCMAWRLVTEYVDSETSNPVSAREMFALIRGGAPTERFTVRWSERGYCGLAGQM